MRRTVALLAALGAHGAIAAGSPYDEARVAFRNRDYAAVNRTLLPVYTNPPSANRRPVGSYWIGASYCRSGQPVAGRNWLNHTARRWRLSDQQLRTLRAEQVRCAPGAPAAPAPPFSEESYNQSTELLYYGTSATLSARPLQPIEAIPDARLAARLAPIGDAAAALAKASVLIDTIEAARGAARPCGLTGRPSAIVAGRFLFVTRRPSSRVYIDSFATVLERYVQRLRQSFALELPDRYITIHLAACADDAALIARSLHGLRIDADQVAGYSAGGDLSLVSLWTGAFDTRTMEHEIFHLVAERAFPDMPQWLDEGMAQYFGVIATDKPHGHTTVLPPSWPELPRLRDVLDAGWFGFDQAPGADRPQPDAARRCIPIATAMMHADVARMFVAYLDDEPGRLPMLFTGLRARTPGSAAPESGDTGAVEALLGRPIEAIEAAYLKAADIQRDAKAAKAFKDIGDAQHACSAQTS